MLPQLARLARRPGRKLLVAYAVGSGGTAGRPVTIRIS
jgi:hypothetical protein